MHAAWDGNERTNERAIEKETWPEGGMRRGERCDVLTPQSKADNEELPLSSKTARRIDISLACRPWAMALARASRPAGMRLAEVCGLAFASRACEPQSAVWECGMHAQASSAAAGDAEPVASEPQGCNGGVPAPSLRIVSWNVLGDSLLRSNPYLYTACRPDALQWRQRLPGIINIIQRLNADVIALQEVENFQRDFQDPLHRYCSLDGVYKQRTGGQADGVALMWRSSRLSLLHVEAVEYANALTRGVTSPAEDERMRKHNVGLIGVFLDRLAMREVVVATTHILFNPKRGIVKLRQLQHLLTRVDALRWPPPAQPAALHSPMSAALHQLIDDTASSDTAASAATASADGRAMVVLGDLNMTPSSLLHGFVRGEGLRAASRSEHEWDGHEAEQRRGQGHRPPEPPELPGEPLVDATHPLAGELHSAYGTSRGEPECTTFHGRFLGTVDYIWFSVKQLGVRTVLPTPSRRELLARRSLPDLGTPSDHIPIACDLVWRAMPSNTGAAITVT